jgi:tRNA-modifying protein YgfZ
METRQTLLSLMNPLWIDLLQNHGATFVDGHIANFGDARAELQSLNTQTIMCDLSHEGLLLVSGDDAAAFLHGQLSNDVLALAYGDAQITSWCSPKGRMLVTPLLWKGKQGYFMQMPRSLQPAIQKRLQMFVLRSKVKLEDLSAEWVKIGVAGVNSDALEANIHAVFGAVPVQAMSSIHADLGRVIRLSKTRFEIIASAENAIEIWKKLTSNVARVGAGVWDLQTIRDGVVQVLAETQDQFVPQAANFELIGGVNFKKGCYPGQEIVARTQYRGILKRRLVRVHSDATNLPKPGESIYAPEFGEQAAGHIANVAFAPEGGFDALVVAQIESIKADSLRLTNLEGALLKVQSLPYEVTFP